MCYSAFIVIALERNYILLLPGTTHVQDCIWCNMVMNSAHSANWNSVMFNTRLNNKWRGINSIVLHPSWKHLFPLSIYCCFITTSLVFDSLCLRDATLRNSAGPTLAKIMACCQTTASYYPCQYWFIFILVLWHISDGIIISTPKIPISKASMKVTGYQDW